MGEAPPCLGRSFEDRRDRSIQVGESITDRSQAVSFTIHVLFSHVPQTKEVFRFYESPGLFIRRCVYSREILSGTGTTGNVVKIWLAASSSNAIPVNRPSPGAVQRTDPTESDVSAPVNTSPMNQDDCPLAARGILTSSSTTPPLH